MRQANGMKISTINRELATVRRMFNLVQEWGKVTTLLPRVRMKPGENQRMRVLAPEEERAYLQASTDAGCGIERAYASAPLRIRSVLRGEQPLKSDPYLLHG